MLAAILLAACARPAAPVSEGFAIYLLAEKLPPAEVAQADLDTLKLEGEPILSTEDIVAYARGTHQITLTPSAKERLGQLEVPVSGAGIPFVVCVDKEPIYSGAFWSPLSSLSFDGTIIMLLPGVMPGAQLDYVRIEANFVSERPDPRPDPRVLRALERAGKLKEDGVSASTDLAQVADVPPEVEEQAQLGLRMYRSQVGLGAILPGSTGSAEEASRITLERGYRLHYIDPDRLRDASGERLLALVYPAPAWLYAVNVDGVSKGSIIVGLEGKQYKIVSWGGFTEDYVALSNMRRFMLQEGASAEPTLIQVGPDYYFATQIGTQEFVLPVISPDKASRGWAGGMDYSRLWPATDVVQYLQKVQREAVPGELG